jgi:hypothetical protein
MTAGAERHRDVAVERDLHVRRFGTDQRADAQCRRLDEQ